MRSSLTGPAFLPCPDPHRPFVAFGLFLQDTFWAELIHWLELLVYTAHLGPLLLGLWASASVFFSFEKSLKSGVSAVTFGNVFTAYRDFLTCFISSCW